MDRTMSAFVKVANRMRQSGPAELGALRRRYASAPALTGLTHRTGPFG